MTSEKDNFQIPTLAAAAVILASSASFCKMTSMPGNSLLLGFVAVLITATVVFVTQRRYQDTENKVLAPLLYLVLAASSPCFPYFSQQHLAAILFSISFLSLVNFSKSQESTLSFAMASLTLMASAIFWPPLMWMAPVYLVIGVIRSGEKMKVAVSLILAAVTPVLIYFAVMYLLGNPDAGVQIILVKLEQCIPLESWHNVHFSMPTILKYLIIVTGIFSASWKIFFRVHIPSMSERWTYWITVVMAFSIIGICLIFYPDAGRTVTMAVCPLSSLLLAQHVSGLKSKKASRIYLFLLIAAALSERLYDFKLDIL